MRVHAAVHGRRYEHGSLGAEIGAGQEIVGESLRHAAERVGGGRHDCEQVGLFRQGDVQDAAGIRREEVYVCRPLRHAGERERRDKSRGIFGKDSR